MRGKVVMQECTQCGEHFPVRYLEDGTYDYIRSFCDCESDFVPIEGQPSISEWMESLTDEKEEITFNQSWREETIIEITWHAKELWDARKLQDIPYEELRDMILDMADKFETYYGTVDWREFDYNEEVMKFTDRELAVVLFDRFSEIPVDPETETMEVDWNGFSKGTSKIKILEWFKETFKGCNCQRKPNVANTTHVD